MDTPCCKRQQNSHELIAMKLETCLVDGCCQGGLFRASRALLCPWPEVATQVQVDIVKLSWWVMEASRPLSLAKVKP